MHLQIHAIATPPLKPLECGSAKLCVPLPKAELIFRPLREREYLRLLPNSLENTQIITQSFLFSKEILPKKGNKYLI